MIEKTDLYTVQISRLNPPFFAILYDHLSKKGRPLENQPSPPNMHLLVDKATRFGLRRVEFDEDEMQALKSNAFVQKQYNQFLNNLPKRRERNGSLKSLSINSLLYYNTLILSLLAFVECCN